VIGRALQKILLHSNHWLESAGYATQIGAFISMLTELGYQPAVSAFHGQQGFYDERELSPGGPKIPVYPAGQHPYGGDVVGMHARHFGADLVISLMDQWAMSHETLEGIPYAAVMPVDTVNEVNPKCALGLHDANSLAAWRSTVPVAMSEHGYQVLTRWQEEFNKVNPPALNRRTPVLYLPHAIDTEVFKPAPGRDQLREGMGIDGLFAVSMVAANRDKARKNFPGQMAAFRRLHARHSDSVLMLHTEEDNPHGLNLRRMAERAGLAPGSYRFSAQYLLATGMIGAGQLAGTMTAADLGSQASTAEGFGLPIAEHLACGTTVAVADHPVMRQVAGPGGWFAESDNLWATGHEAWWRMPREDALLKIYETAYHACKQAARKQQGCPEAGKAARPYAVKQAAARRHVIDNFSLDVVRDKHLVPVLAALGAHFGMD
jgi:glycosyltransferase involved in cell wall biosynthesis